MTGLRPAGPIQQRQLRGARIWFDRGSAKLRPNTEFVPDGWVASSISVVSAGTELRQLTATQTGPPRPAGYMAMAVTGGQTLVAPVSHGAPFDPRGSGILSAPLGPRIAALARFQLMAALGLDVAPSPHAEDVPVVVGSGTVALGCALELRRRGARHIRLLTARRQAAAAELPWVEVRERVEPGAASLVLECSGRRTGDAIRAAGECATVGLLGTPHPGSVLDAERAHRSSLRLLGMHELAGHDDASRQHAFAEVAGWLDRNVEPALLDNWCNVVPGSCAPALYRALQAGRRPSAPLLLLEWAP